MNNVDDFPKMIQSEEDDIVNEETVNTYGITEEETRKILIALNDDKKIKDGIKKIKFNKFDIEEYVWSKHGGEHSHSPDPEDDGNYSWFIKYNNTPKELADFLTELIQLSRRYIYEDIIRYSEQKLKRGKKVPYDFYVGELIGKGYRIKNPDRSFECRRVRIVVKFIYSNSASGRNAYVQLVTAFPF